MKRFAVILALMLTALSGLSNISVLNTFTSGELSPYMDARVDFERYSAGCSTIENFIVLPYGGVNKRSGTEYIAETKSNGVVRLESFSIGVDQSYVMEFGDRYIRFYADGVRLVDTNSDPLEVESPYSSDDVFQLQMAKNADTIYIAHPDYPVYKLQRTSITPTFTMEEVDWYWPPVIDQNVEDITITPSAVTGSVTITASEDLFTTNDVDSSWQIRSLRDTTKVTINLASSTTSVPLKVEGDWGFMTSGSWGGVINIQISEDDGDSWGDYREYKSIAGALVNYDRTGTEPDAGMLYRLKFVASGTTSGSATLISQAPYLNGWVTITNYLSATQVQAVVGSELASTNATKSWSKAAFSRANGYPRCVEFYENRLFLGATEYNVNTIWGSMTDDYENFKTGTYDDSALRFTINSDNIIEWMLSRSQLFIGTLGDEWILSGGDSSTALTPTAVQARKQTGFGSKEGINAIIASDSLLYLQRQGRKLREFEYSLEADAYVSQDTTIIAEHITDGGIVQICSQQQPEPVIWCIRNDGQLVGMTYNKLQNVYGWHRQVTDGDFESVASIPTEGEDRVYVVVKRTINGVEKRYVEWFAPVDWGDDDNAWFVDSGLEFDGGDAVAVTDIDVDTNGVVTVEVENSWSDGDNIQFSGVSGMTELENYTFSVTNSSATNLQLAVDGTADMIDASGWTAWTGTASVFRVEKDFSTLSHLAGKDVVVFGDGGVMPTESVNTNGTVSIDEYKNHVIIGLPYTATLSPMYIDVADQSGLSYSKTKQPYRIQFRVKDSGAFKYGVKTNDLFSVSVRSPSLAAGAPVPFYSGDTLSYSLKSTPSTSPRVYVVSDEPLPLSLLSLSVFTSVKEIE